MRGVVSRDKSKYATVTVAALALLYAFLAGLRTVGDPDLGWQMATGRWIVQNRAIPSTDVLSYTAAGHEWIYPALSQVLLYISYVVGGYTLLSLLGAIACVAAVALLLREPSARILALLAVPLIAEHTGARADMFTAVLFAAFVSILWRYHRGVTQPLWVLPLLMCLWVNLHLGFIAGLGMCAAYICLELESAFLLHDTVAMGRLRKAWSWLAATALATVVNPWGPRIYVALLKQARIQDIHNVWIQEWSSIPLTVESFRQFFALREAASAQWWMITAAGIAVLCALVQRRIFTALLLATSTYLYIHSSRMEASFACVVAVIGGTVISDSRNSPWVSQKLIGLRSKTTEVWLTRGRLAVAASLLLLVTVRSADLISSRHYLRSIDKVSVFGVGPSPWLPQRATSFILTEHLPANIYNDYNVGGYTAWALSPAYSDYIDGRAVPFGIGHFFQSLELLQAAFDSNAWTDEANRRGINTALISLDHVLGGGTSNLRAFCSSQSWRPVYLDARAAVFVRNTQQTQGLLERLAAIDCTTAQVQDSGSYSSFSGDANKFALLLNAGGILNALGRNGEALQKLSVAEAIFEESPDLHYQKGVAFYSTQAQTDAERELKRSLQLAPSEQTTTLLAMLYRDEGRTPEGIAVLEKGIELSTHPHQLYFERGVLQLDSGQASEALNSFDEAERSSPFMGEAKKLGTGFFASLADGRESAWLRLANEYQSRGLQSEAQQARAKAAMFASGGSSRVKQ